MKKLLLLLSILFSLQVEAATYYVSASGGTGAGSIGSPWSIAKWRTETNAGNINPGDSILFQKGNVFTSASQIGFSGSPNSGTALNPIVLSSYGSGAKPRWECNTSTGAFHLIGIDYWIFDGLNFQDITFSASDKNTTAPLNCGIRLGDFPNGTPSNHNIIRNCDVDRAGLGFVIAGDFNLIENCTVTDLRNVVNTIGGSEDYGANGISLSGNDNTIQDCLFTGNWCSSYDFGFSGGWGEFFGSCKRNKFLRNRVYDCGAIAEYGSSDPNTTSDHNRFAYNQIISCGSLSYINFNNEFTTTATNTEIYNNVIIEKNGYSRFSGSNSGDGLGSPFAATWASQTSATGETALLGFTAGEPNDTIFDLRNNIFILENSQDVAANPTVASRTVHLNNVYKLSGGSTLGYSINVSEVSTSSQLVLGEGASDPIGWDYHLSEGSPALAVGAVIIGLTEDFYGLTLFGPRNAGIDNSTGDEPPPVNDTLRFPLKINGTLYNSIKN